jgi:hypothetical protein
MREKLARSKASKRSSLRRRNDNQHFKPKDQLHDAFNKGMTPRVDAVTSIGQTAKAMRSFTETGPKSGRRHEDTEALRGPDLGPQAQI